MTAPLREGGRQRRCLAPWGEAAGVPLKQWCACALRSVYTRRGVWLFPGKRQASTSLNSKRYALTAEGARVVDTGVELLRALLGDHRQVRAWCTRAHMRVPQLSWLTRDKPVHTLGTELGTALACMYYRTSDSLCDGLKAQFMLAAAEAVRPGTLAAPPAPPLLARRGIGRPRLTVRHEPDALEGLQQASVRRVPRDALLSPAHRVRRAALAGLNTRFVRFLLRSGLKHVAAT